jgi:succinate dehydrogenase/fumarate reductase flavoprotein subunit
VGRLFYDTIKGGDFRSREANVYRLAQVSTQIIDQCVALGIPFAREVRRAVGESVVWWRPSLADILLSRTDRAAASLRGLFGALLAD